MCHQGPIPRSGVQQDFLGYVHGGAAVQAQAPREPLRRDQHHAGGNIKRRNAHIAHATQRRRCVIGVQG